MSYVALARDLPQELQLPVLNLVEAVRKDLHRELAVRRKDFNELAAVVRELAEAQKRTEQRLDRLEAVVEELAEAQKRTEQRLDRLEAVVQELAEAQKRTEQRMEELAEAQRHTTVSLMQLATSQAKMEQRLDRVWGYQLEQRYRERAYAYFGTILRRVEAVPWQDIEAGLEQHLTPEELNDLILLDVLLRGRLKQPEAPEVWLAMEVSAVIDGHDVDRACRRAALLRRAGYVVVPAVAGEDATVDAVETARSKHVLLIEDGRKRFWEPALAEALAAGGH